jgi:hypothetical protein
VEALNTTTIRRFTRSRRHQLLAIALTIPSIRTRRSATARREFRKQTVEKTTENAVGAVRRRMKTEATGSSPPASHRAETLSVWLDASAGVDHP